MFLLALEMLHLDKPRRLYCVEWIQYSIHPKRVTICIATGVGLGPPESSTQTASRSLQPFLQGSLNDRPTDRPCYSVSNNRWSAQWRIQILLLSTATTSIYWRSRLKYTMPAVLS